VHCVGGEESTHRLLVLATQKLSPATNQTPTPKMKTDNWLLRDSTTRVTDNRDSWRYDFEEYHANKDASTIGDYLNDESRPQYPKIRWDEIGASLLEIACLFTIGVFIYYFANLIAKTL